MRKAFVFFIFLSCFLFVSPIFSVTFETQRDEGEVRNEPIVTRVQPSQNSPEMIAYAPGKVIIKLKPGVERSSVTFRGSPMSLTNVMNVKTNDEAARKVGLDRIYLADTPVGSELSIAKELSLLPDVEYAEPNFIYKTQFIPNDPLFSQQWAHTVANAPNGWDIEQGDSSVVIAIIDTGVDYNHEDLAGNMLGNCTNGCPNGTGFDFVDIDLSQYEQYGYVPVEEEDYAEPDDMPSDYYGHGTHVAGIAAATSNNSMGVAGVCHGCRLMPIRAGFTLRFGSQYYGFLENDEIISSIYYAADNGADVISMSFGGPYESSAVRDALSYAYSRGAILVAAAGNSNTNTRFFPAAYENVIAVAALTTSSLKAWYSNFGYWADIAAPGGDAAYQYPANDILSTVPSFGPLGDPSGYRTLAGTSMAAPYIAGFAGLILSRNASYNQEQVKQIMQQNAIRPTSQRQWYIGRGKINVRNSLLVQGMPTLGARIASPAPGTFLRTNGSIAIIGNALNGTNYSVYRSNYGIRYYPTFWTEIAFGNSQITNGTLAVWDTTNSVAGTYVLKLVVRHPTGVFEDYAIYVADTQKSGWPRDVGAEIMSTPVVKDIDYDGLAEIFVISTDGQMHLMNSAGNYLNGWPRISPEWVYGPYNYWDVFGHNSPVISDIDGDGQYEIIAVGSIATHVLDMNGNEKPGWPRGFYGYGLWANGIVDSPTVNDLDGDGFDEIIFSRGNSLFVYESNGSPRAGWPQVYPPEYILEGTPTVADLNSDGQKEIIFAGGDTVNGITNLTIFDASGFVANSWMIDGTNRVHTSPVIGDIDNDSRLDIIVTTSNGVYAFDSNGTQKSGWPGLTQPANFLALGDLNRDGELETIAGRWDNDYFVHLYDNAGVEIQTWPRMATSFYTYSSTVGDIDGDNYSEVLLPEYGFGAYPFGNIDLWSYSGSAGWFKFTLGGITSSPVLADLEGDGNVEMVTADREGLVYVWDLGQPMQQLQWPDYHHDTEHTGAYGYEAALQNGSPDLSILLEENGMEVHDGIFYYNLSTITENIGNRPSGPFVINISFGSYSYGTIPVENLAPGESLRRRHLPACSTDEGLLIQAWADPQNETNDTNRLNNYAMLDMPPCGFPDLIISDLSAPHFVLVGRTFTFNVTTLNNGTTGTVTSGTRVTAIGQQAWNYFIQPLLPGESDFNVGAFACQQPGNLAISAIADIGNTNIENDEQNNARTMIVRCLNLIRGNVTPEIISDENQSMDGGLPELPPEETGKEISEPQNKEKEPNGRSASIFGAMTGLFDNILKMLFGEK